jgi:hypothetical protein
MIASAVSHAHDRGARSLSIPPHDSLMVDLFKSTTYINISTGMWKQVLLFVTLFSQAAGFLPGHSRYDGEDLSVALHQE